MTTIAKRYGLTCLIFVHYTRDEKNEINDIKFMFSFKDDTAKKISSELYNNKLIKIENIDIITENLNKWDFLQFYF